MLVEYSAVGCKSLLVSTQLAGVTSVWSESVRLHKSISHCGLMCELSTDKMWVVGASGSSGEVFIKKQLRRNFGETNGEVSASTVNKSKWVLEGEGFIQVTIWRETLKS